MFRSHVRSRGAAIAVPLIAPGLVGARRESSMAGWRGEGILHEEPQRDEPVDRDGEGRAGRPA